jgi:hypothetical protein
LKKRAVSLSGFTGLGARRGNGANDERSERGREKKKYGLQVGVVSLLSLVLALFLLYDSKLSGTEFVAFVIAFIDEVQEFSLGGNRIKFRELKIELIKCFNSF